MDFDGDGTLDIISGSYDPGDIYLFRGLGKGRYAGVEQILDEAGTPLVHHPEELKAYERMKNDPTADEEDAITMRMASFGSWPGMVDWDNDGDFDMLIGSYSGGVYLRLNTGSRTSPRFSSASAVVEAGGQALWVWGHADPVPADWDADGLWDLVVGNSNGGVVWYRNAGTRSAPQFEAPRTLVEDKELMMFFQQPMNNGDSPTPGVRAQIDVVDYDLDGKLDLLVGDYSFIWTENADGTYRTKDGTEHSFIWFYRRK